MITKSMVTKKLAFDDKQSSQTQRKGLRARKTTATTETFDLTRLNSTQMNNLLDGVDIEVDECLMQEKQQKKVDAGLKRASEEAVHTKIVNTKNLFASPFKDPNRTIANSGTPKISSGKSAKEFDGLSAWDLSPKCHLSSSSSNAVESARPSESNGIATKSARPLESSGNATKSARSPESSSNAVESAHASESSSYEVNKSVQTDKVFIGCGCDSCFGIFTKFFEHGQGQKYVVRESEQIAHLPCNNANEESVNASGEQIVVLLKGCPQVKLPISRKAALASEVADGNPQKIVNFLLDSLYPVETQAKMTHDGKSKGTSKLPSDVAKVLQVYTAAKYNKKDFQFDKSLFKYFVNSKFYSARRYVWKNKPELVGENGVRPPMKKHMKKSMDNASPRPSTGGKRPKTNLVGLNDLQRNKSTASNSWTSEYHSDVSRGEKTRQNHDHDRKKKLDSRKRDRSPTRSKLDHDDVRKRKHDSSKKSRKQECSPKRSKLDFDDDRKRKHDSKKSSKKDFSPKKSKLDYASSKKEHSSSKRSKVNHDPVLKKKRNSMWGSDSSASTLLIESDVSDLYEADPIVSSMEDSESDFS